MITKEQLKNMPESPGVYLMKDSKDEVLYIGKAKNIRNRVRSYFQETSDTRYTVKFLASKISDIAYIITTNEKEAIILEDILLKKHKPKYNIRLKDDKTYVSIKLALFEKFPRILVTRQIKKDGSRYFGPYASAQKARETVRFIRRIFPLCTCSPSEFRNRVRPCLDYQLGICPAPCVNLISEEDYKKLADKAILFLEGKSRELLSELKAAMSEASEEQEFEKAAKIRDQIAAIEATLEEQKVVSQEKIDRDIFAHVTEEGSIIIQAMFVRDGRLSGTRGFFFSNQEFPAHETFSSFLTQYYGGDRFIPDEIIVSAAIEDRSAIEDWLSEKKGKKVKIIFPSKGSKLKLLKMAEANAKEALKQKTETVEKKQALLEELQKRLRLKNIPKIIEAFDISNISGKLAVGAMVTFADAKPNKDRYRLYKIQSKEEPDDYGMMKEVLFRRYQNEDAPFPSLILMDGGKGQLNIAVKVMDELGVKGIAVAAIAKEKEHGLSEKVYLPNVKDQVVLREGSAPDLFIRKIRDEVHRFAITYHKKLRGKIKSALDEIHGIGKKKKSALLRHFGSIEKIKEASVEEIAGVNGITMQLAEKIKKALTANNG